MQNIQEELNLLKFYIEKSFIDPFPEDRLKYFVLSGSKYIRSALAVLYLKSQGVDIVEDIYKILVAGELIHNASLLHDDVIDGAETRRKKITLAKEFSSKISILAGDHLLSTAIEILLELNNTVVLNIFQSCIKDMTQAEIKQFFLRENLSSEEEYIEICRNKTGKLFSAILKSSAIIANLSFKDAEIFGENFGLCFQIKNDCDFESAENDRKNGIYTAKDVLGVEKTEVLLDNCKKDMFNIIKDFPENIYKESLKDLIKLL